MLEPIAERKENFKNQGEIEITIAPNAGACFGVVRAIKLAKNAVKKAKRQQSSVFALGELIHNPMVVNELESDGVKTVSQSKAADQGSVILRSHGVRKEIEGDLRSRGLEVVDATCPLVKKPQRIAQSLGAKGYFLVLVGDKNHPEVQGVLSYFAQDNYLVTYDPKDVALIDESVTQVGVIAQTTIEYRVLDAVVAELKGRFNEVSVFNTICDATSIRQSEAETLARSADVMVVVGGKNSSNTKKLVKICQLDQPNTHLIETKEEIQKSWFDGMKKIGVTGGASTPQDYVDQVGEYIAAMLQ